MKSIEEEIKAAQEEITGTDEIERVKRLLEQIKIGKQVCMAQSLSI